MQAVEELAVKSLPSITLAAKVELETAVGVRVRMYSHRTKSSKEWGSSSGMVSLSSRDSLKPELKADLKKSEMPERRFSWIRHWTSLGPTSTVTIRSEKSLWVMMGQYQDCQTGRSPGPGRGGGAALDGLCEWWQAVSHSM